VTAVLASLKRFGGGPGASDRFSLNAVVADAVTLVEERLRASAELELRLGTVPEIRGDGLEVGHVVLALLTNAIEAVEKKGVRGHVAVTTYVASGKATLVVRDDGTGIDEKVLERAFEPFVTTKEGQPSAGLGLHSAYKVIQRAGGTIRIRSRPGDGATVTVLMPLQESPVKV
jgi:signal transduction histidine kinase